MSIRCGVRYAPCAVERQATDSTPAVMSQSTLYSSGGYNLNVTDPAPSGSYMVDIRTDNGYQTQLSGIVPDSAGNFSIAESNFALDDPNFLRIRREGEGEAYSAPLTLTIDSTVTSSSENQIRVRNRPTPLPTCTTTGITWVRCESSPTPPGNR